MSMGCRRFCFLENLSSWLGVPRPLPFGASVSVRFSVLAGVEISGRSTDGKQRRR